MIYNVQQSDLLRAVSFPPTNHAYRQNVCIFFSLDDFSLEWLTLHEAVKFCQLADHLISR